MWSGAERVLHVWAWLWLGESKAGRSGVDWKGKGGVHARTYRLRTAYICCLSPTTCLYSQVRHAKREWSLAEDAMLTALMQSDLSWNQIVAQLPPERTAWAARNRWVRLCRMST